MRFRGMRSFTAALFIWLVFAPAAQAAECADMWQWLDFACRRLVDTYQQGRNDVYLSGYTWHTPWTWTAEKRAEENANAWGLGVGRSREQADGDTDLVYALVFADSHKNPEWNVGYAWNTYWGPRRGLQVGLGYTAAIVVRTDIAKGLPFPVVLPLGSVRYDRVSLFGTYIPNLGGGINQGSVFYFFAKVTLD